MEPPDPSLDPPQPDRRQPDELDRYVATSGNRITVAVEALAGPHLLDLGLALRQQLPDLPGVQRVDDVDYANRQVVLTIDPYIFGGRDDGLPRLVAAIRHIEDLYL